MPPLQHVSVCSSVNVCNPPSTYGCIPLASVHRMSLNMTLKAIATVFRGNAGHPGSGNCTLCITRSIRQSIWLCTCTVPEPEIFTEIYIMYFVLLFAMSFLDTRLPEFFWNARKFWDSSRSRLVNTPNIRAHFFSMTNTTHLPFITRKHCEWQCKAEANWPMLNIFKNFWCTIINYANIHSQDGLKSMRAHCTET